MNRNYGSIDPAANPAGDLGDDQTIVREDRGGSEEQPTVEKCKKCGDITKQDKEGALNLSPLAERWVRFHRYAPFCLSFFCVLLIVSVWKNMYYEGRVESFIQKQLSSHNCTLFREDVVEATFFTYQPCSTIDSSRSYFSLHDLDTPKYYHNQVNCTEHFPNMFLYDESYFSSDELAYLQILIQVSLELIFTYLIYEMLVLAFNDLLAMEYQNDGIPNLYDKVFHMFDNTINLQRWENGHHILATHRYSILVGFWFTDPASRIRISATSMMYLYEIANCFYAAIYMWIKMTYRGACTEIDGGGYIVDLTAMFFGFFGLFFLSILGWEYWVRNFHELNVPLEVMAARYNDMFIDKQFRFGGNNKVDVRMVWLNMICFIGFVAISPFIFAITFASWVFPTMSRNSYSGNSHAVNSMYEVLSKISVTVVYRGYEPTQCPQDENHFVTLERNVDQ